MTRSWISMIAVAAALTCSAAPAAPAPAPVPDSIPVAMMVDLSTGQTLFAREIDRRFMPASVTKVMTAYTAFRLIDEGKISPSTRFLYTEELEEEWYNQGSSMWLRAGERPTVGELLLGVTTISGNDASVALAIAATGSIGNWLELMNRNAADLGMRDTHFGGANGYPDEGLTFTSASDLARLGEAIVSRYPGLYRRYFGNRTLTWNDVTQANHDPVTGRVRGADGMKTGFTNEAGYTFLGSGERAGRRLVMVLAGAPTAAERNTTARDFLEWGFDAFTRREYAPAGAVLTAARVQDGSQSEIGLRAPGGVAVAVPDDFDGEVDFSVRYHGPIEAPVEEGEEIAVLRVEIEGQDPFDIPLVAAETVRKAGFFRRIFNGIAGLFA